MQQRLSKMQHWHFFSSRNVSAHMYATGLSKEFGAPFSPSTPEEYCTLSRSPLYVCEETSFPRMSQRDLSCRSREKLCGTKVRGDNAADSPLFVTYGSCNRNAYWITRWYKERRVQSAGHKSCCGYSKFLFKLDPTIIVCQSASPIRRGTCCTFEYVWFGRWRNEI